MEFKCNICKKEFKYQYLLDRHNERKTPCNPVMNVDPNAEFACQFCGRSYANRHNLKRHYEICKARKDKNIIRDHVIDKKQKRIEELEKTKATNSNEANTTNVNANANEINHSNVAGRDIYDIHIHNYGNLLQFDESEMAILVQKVMSAKGKGKNKAENIKTELHNFIKENQPKKAFAYLLEKIHNNDDIPEAQNLFIVKEGPLKDNYICFSPPYGWVATTLPAVMNVGKSEMVTATRFVDWDPKDKKTMKFINNFNKNKSKFIESLISAAVTQAIKKFGLSNNNEHILINEEFVDYNPEDYDSAENSLEEKVDERELIRREMLEKAKNFTKVDNKYFGVTPPPSEPIKRGPGYDPDYKHPEREEDVTMDDLRGYPQFDTDDEFDVPDISFEVPSDFEYSEDSESESK